MIYLQSDLVNMPTEDMWEAMRQVDIGTMGQEDPIVKRLQEKVARLLGKEAALLILTGRMACSVALLSNAQQGNQVIMEENAHI